MWRRGGVKLRTVTGVVVEEVQACRAAADAEDGLALLRDLVPPTHRTLALCTREQAVDLGRGRVRRIGEAGAWGSMRKWVAYLGALLVVSARQRSAHFSISAFSSSAHVSISAHSRIPHPRGGGRRGGGGLVSRQVEDRSATARGQLRKGARK